MHRDFHLFTLKQMGQLPKYMSTSEEARTAEHLSAAGSAKAHSKVRKGDIKDEAANPNP